MKKIMVIISLLMLSACAGKDISVIGNEGKDGISLVFEISKEKQKNGSIVYDYVCTFTNDSDQDIAEISYEIELMDKNGNKLFSSSNKWIGEDTPLKAGETVKTEGSFQYNSEADQATGRIIAAVPVGEAVEVSLPQAGDLLYQAYDSAAINNILTDRPQKVEIVIDHMGAQVVTVIEGADLDKFLEVFTKVKVLGENNIFVTDNYNAIVFYFKDGQIVRMPFILYSLEIMADGREHLYTLENGEALWAFAQK